MKRIGFFYEDRFTNYEHSKNRDCIIKKYDDYLDCIRKYREEGRHVHYQDGTWVFRNMTCAKVWKYMVGICADDCFMLPSRRGEALYCHKEDAPK